MNNSPQNSGIVALTEHRLIYLLTLSGDNYRLGILSYGFEDGIFYGGLLTTSSAKMSERIPTATPFVLKKLKEGDIPFSGAILPEHPSYVEALQLLETSRAEGFFRSI